MTVNSGLGRGKFGVWGCLDWKKKSGVICDVM